MCSLLLSEDTRTLIGVADAKEQMRKDKVRILLRTRNDAYPTLRASGTPYTTAGPGKADDLRKSKCPACQGTGKTRLHQKCEACDGKGRFAVDGYVGRVSDQSGTIRRHMTPEARDAEISRLSTSLRLSAGDPDPSEKYGWERAREAQTAAGSYRELERALETLRDRHVMEWEFILWAYGPLHPEPGKLDRQIEDMIIGRIADMMPRRIKVPSREWQTLREKRRAKVKELRHEATAEEIAEIVGLPVRAVAEILAA